MQSLSDKLVVITNMVMTKYYSLQYCSNAIMMSLTFSANSETVISPSIPSASKDSCCLVLLLPHYSIHLHYYSPMMWWRWKDKRHNLNVVLDGITLYSDNRYIWAWWYRTDILTSKKTQVTAATPSQRVVGYCALLECVRESVFKCWDTQYLGCPIIYTYLGELWWGKAMM